MMKTKCMNDMDSYNDGIRNSDQAGQYSSQVNCNSTLQAIQYEPVTKKASYKYDKPFIKSEENPLSLNHIMLKKLQPVKHSIKHKINRQVSPNINPSTYEIVTPLGQATYPEGITDETNPVKNAKKITKLGSPLSQNTNRTKNYLKLVSSSELGKENLSHCEVKSNSNLFVHSPHTSTTVTQRPYILGTPNMKNHTDLEIKSTVTQYSEGNKKINSLEDNFDYNMENKYTRKNKDLLVDDRKNRSDFKITSQVSQSVLNEMSTNEKFEDSLKFGYSKESEEYLCSLQFPSKKELITEQKPLREENSKEECNKKILIEHNIEEQTAEEIVDIKVKEAVNGRETIADLVLKVWEELKQCRENGDLQRKECKVASRASAKQRLMRRSKFVVSKPMLSHKIYNSNEDEDKCKKRSKTRSKATIVQGNSIGISAMSANSKTASSDSESHTSAGNLSPQKQNLNSLKLISNVIIVDETDNINERLAVVQKNEITDSSSFDENKLGSSLISFKEELQPLDDDKIYFVNNSHENEVNAQLEEEQSEQLILNLWLKKLKASTQKNIIPITESNQKEYQLLQSLALIEKLLDCNHKQQVIVLETEHALLIDKNNLMKKLLDQSTFGNENSLDKSDSSINIKESSRGFLSQFTSPYFKDEFDFGCEPNDDFKEKSKSWEILTHQQPPSRKKWQKSIPDNVAQAIKESIIDDLLERCDLKSLLHKLQCVKDKTEANTLQVTIKQIDAKVKMLKKKTLKDLLRDDMNCAFDWMKISAKKSTLGLSPKECEKVWKLILKPRLTFSWSSGDNEKLRRLAEENHFQDWDSIAAEINSNLSGYFCFLHFRKTMSKSLYNRGPWTKEEDANLQNLVNKSRYGNHIQWSKVVYFLEDRSVNQILNRWYRLNPMNKRGKFTSEEDSLLMISVQEFGKDFGKISSIFGNRSPVQLRERYFTQKHMLDKLKMGEWSLQEDKLLLSLVKLYGESKWVQIAKQFPTRNRTQIRHRYNNVLKKKIEENPNFNLDTLNRFKRNTHINSLNKRSDEEPNIKYLIKNVQKNMAAGKIAIKKCNRSGRRPAPDVGLFDYPAISQDLPKILSDTNAS